MINILETYFKELWPIFTGFLILGVKWYWNNKKTKNQEKEEKLNNINKEVETDSKEISNMKELMILFQDNFKSELLEKNETINKLSKIIQELNNKIDILSKNIKLLNIRMDNKDLEILEIANKCKGRKQGEICVVLQHLKNKDDKKKL